MTADAGRLAAAYDTCLAIARGHYENFPVASWLVPATVRPHVAAIYAFARTADDYADEDGYTTRERLRLLDEWLDALHRSLGAGEPIEADLGPTSTAVFTALAHTVRTFDLPVALLEALLSASLAPQRGTALVFGAGTGIWPSSAGYGAPLFRLFLALQKSFEPER